MKLRIALLACLALGAGCATTARPSYPQPEFALQQTPPNYPSNYPPPMTSLSTPPPQQPREFTPPPPPLMTAAQGWFGISYVETRDVDTGSGAGNISDIDVDSDEMPMIGGAFMHPFGGNKLRFGLEGGLNMGWQGNVEAVAIGGGGAFIAADADVFLFDLFGGPFVEWRIAPQARAYLAGGVNLQWAAFDYDFGVSHVNEDGFGDGLYGRTGFEYQVSPGTWMGLGLRIVDSTIDPGGKIDAVELRQTQYLFTVTHSL